MPILTMQARTPSSSSVAKAKRRRAQPDNAPMLTFITASDPREFKNDNNKKGVRSQAMKNFRRRQRIEQSSALATPPARTPRSESESPQYTPLETPIVFSFEDVEQHEQYLHLPMYTLAPQHSSAPAVQCTLPNTAHNKPHDSRSHGTSVSTVTGYEASQSHQQFMVGMLLDDLAQHHVQYLVDDGQTVILPTVPNLGPSAEFLLNTCKSSILIPACTCNNIWRCTECHSNARLYHGFDPHKVVLCYAKGPRPYL
jgi:hypothetical protein